MIGVAQAFSFRVLPTFADVIKQYRFIYCERKEKSRYDPSISELSNAVAVEIENIWGRASIPIEPRRNIVRKIKTYYEAYQRLKKYPKKKKKTQNLTK